MVRCRTSLAARTLYHPPPLYHDQIRLDFEPPNVFIGLLPQLYHPQYEVSRVPVIGFAVYLPPTSTSELALGYRPRQGNADSLFEPNADLGRVVQIGVISCHTVIMKNATFAVFVGNDADRVNTNPLVPGDDSVPSLVQRRCPHLNY